MDDERNSGLKEFFETLSPLERHRRIVLEPAFRDEYNEISQAHRQFPIPAYLWERWVPVLGLLPVAVYIELRRMCFVNAATGERRTIVWPKQETLATRLGVKKRHTISAAILELEAHGFITRERSTYNDPASGRVRRGTTKYQVWWEFPLVDADAVELLLRQASKGVRGAEDRRAEKGPFGGEPVDNSDRRAEKRPQPQGQKAALRTITRTNTINVNVIEEHHLEHHIEAAKPPRESETKTPEERERIQRLAFEISESLETMSGSRGGGEHRNHRYHLLLASALPEPLIRRALMATRDAVEAQRSGRGGLRSDPGAFFTGTARNLAAEQGLVFPASKHPKAAVTPEPGPRAGLGGRIASPPAAEEDRPVPPEQAKRYLAEIIANLSSKSGTRT